MRVKGASRRLRARACREASPVYRPLVREKRDHDYADPAQQKSPRPSHASWSLGVTVRRHDVSGHYSDLGGRPAPALHQGERGAPAARFLELGLALLAERRELIGAHQRQQALLERGGELQRQPEIGVLWGKRDDLSPDASFDTELPQQMEMPSARFPISPAPPKRLHDQLDQPLQGGRRRIEVPGARVGVLEHDDSARPREPEVRLHLIVRASQGRDLVPGVHEVERARLELAREQVVLDEADIAEALLCHKPVGRAEHRTVDVGSGYLSVRSDPLAEDPQPPERSAAEVQSTRAAAVADLLEQPSTARLPDPGLKLQALELRDLSSQQVPLRLRS